MKSTFSPTQLAALKAAQEQKRVEIRQAAADKRMAATQPAASNGGGTVVQRRTAEAAQSSSAPPLPARETYNLGSAFDSMFGFGYAGEYKGELKKLRAIIVPGNGDGDVRNANFYGWLKEKLSFCRLPEPDEHLPIFDEIVLENMPDPVRARRDVWLPHMLQTLKADENAVVIGHSSGAVATLRLLETHKLHGAVIVSPCHTDLGDMNEALSGYYPPSGGEWQWRKIFENCGGNLVLLHGSDDPLIPLAEAEFVARQLAPCPLHVCAGAGHFWAPHKELVVAATTVAMTRRTLAPSDPKRYPHAKTGSGTAVAGGEAPPAEPTPIAPPANRVAAADGRRARRVIIVPANGTEDVSKRAWYDWLRSELEDDDLKVILPSMPDGQEATMRAWLPHIEGLGIDERTVLVGHGVGAICVLRLLERNRCYGALLVGVTSTPDESVKGLQSRTGYFRTPWRWDKMIPNCRRNVLVINSTHCLETVALHDGQHVAEQLGVDCHACDVYLNWPYGVIAEAAHAVVGTPPARPVKLLALTAGLSSGVFSKWHEQLQLPSALKGRGGKLTIESVELSGGGGGGGASIVEMGRRLAAQLVDSPGKLDGAYVLLGHALGAWLAFEVVTELERRGARLPELLVVSGIRAPHLHEPRHDADRATPELASLPPQAFWAAFGARYGVNPDFEIEGVQEAFEPMLREQMRLLETYAPSRSTREPLPCRVLACAQQNDARVLPFHLTSWEVYAEPGRFEEAWLPDLPHFRPSWSNPHRYLLDAPGGFLALLAERCADVSRDAAAAAAPHQPIAAPPPVEELKSVAVALEAADLADIDD